MIPILQLGTSGSGKLTFKTKNANPDPSDSEACYFASCAQLLLSVAPQTKVRTGCEFLNRMDVAMNGSFLGVK